MLNNQVPISNHNNNSASNNLNTLVSRGPQLPVTVTVQKANREDINDKFCKFEIKISKFLQF